MFSKLRIICKQTVAEGAALEEAELERQLAEEEAALQAEIIAAAEVEAQAQALSDNSGILSQSKSAQDAWSSAPGDGVWRYKALSEGVIRSAAAMDSAKATSSTLTEGEVITVTERTEIAGGTFGNHA